MFFDKMKSIDSKNFINYNIEHCNFLCTLQGGYFYC